MNKPLIIVSIILLSVVAITLSIFGFLFSIGKIEFNDNWYNMFNNQSTKLVDSKEYDEVNDIYIKSNTADVNIEYSDNNKFKVELYSDDYKNESIDLDDKDLKIDLEEKSTWTLFRKQPHIVLYIPSDYSNKIDVTSVTGDLKTRSFESASFKIQVTTGDIDIEKADILDITTKTGDITNNKVNTILLHCTTGDIRLGEVNKSLDIVTTTGDVKIDTINILENSKIKTTTGDVVIGSKNNVYVETESKTGDVNINNNDRYAEYVLNIQVTTGDIKVG